MTRETKIGLLVGLGFIVVFAVLLSHNGTGPSPVQTLPPVALATPSDNTQSPSATLTPPPVTEPVETAAEANQDTAEGTGSWSDPVGGQMAAGGTGSDLPAPLEFERPGIIQTGNSAEDSNMGMGLADGGTPREGSLESTRFVPPVAEPPVPEPGARPDAPTVSHTPNINVELDPSPVDHPGAPADGSHAVTAPAKPYLVHKGDTLVKITKEFYGKSTPDVISLVVDANKGVVKSRDSVREGQTILIPALPADMFEKTNGGMTTSDMSAVDRMINPADHRGKADSQKSAPKNTKPAPPVIPGVSPATTGGSTYVAAKGSKNLIPPDNTSKPGADNKQAAGTDGKKPAGNTSATGKVDNSDKGEKSDAAKSGTPGKDNKKGTTTPPKPKPGLRTYEIQPKDTFTSIAQRELGSAARVAEIKQLNKGIDSAKMKPGMKIKIPTRQPLSGDMTARQVTA